MDSKFKVFYWYSFMKGLINGAYQDGEPHPEGGARKETVHIMVDQIGVKVYDNVLHYVYCPAEYESWTLYDYLRMTSVKKS